MKLAEAGRSTWLKLKVEGKSTQEAVARTLLLCCWWRNIMNCTRTVQNVTKIAFFEVADYQK